MDQQKAKEVKDQPASPRKTCSRHKEHASKNASEVAPKSSAAAAHSGLKFHFNLKKVTTPKPFHFNTSSRTEKVTPRSSAAAAHSGLEFHSSSKKVTIPKPFHFNTSSRTEKKSPCIRRKEAPVEKQLTPANKSGDSTDGLKAKLNSLKISKSTEPKTKAKAPIKVKAPLSPKIDALTVKKPCTRCTKTTKEEKSETNVVKTKEESVEVKFEAQQHSKTVKTETVTVTERSPCKKQCSKLAKLLHLEVQENASVVKSVKTTKSEVISQENGRCSPASNRKVRACAEKSESNCSKANAGSDCSKAPKVEKTGHETPTSNGITPESDLLNGAESDSKLFNGARDETNATCESPDPDISNEMKKDLEDAKLMSKIPRKTQASSGVKFHPCLKKDPMEQSVRCENECPNTNNQPTNVMESVVN